ncbi:MAG: SPOR domain-containing protein [Bradyrhizobium sp.]|uniref:SPOR domain-containing protein n=1 Tax=Bradyrhizobium sp. TaxID=376 RepID=UPI001210B145|nr:SPOR domain-containing protein [Bradyrhizobium sp.]THD60789.1 MAG: SPOR domain-containing protein [Bradyrhizobium sp.]
MADRYQDRPFPAHDDYAEDDYDRSNHQHASARAESDPLAELARLIGQTDQFAIGRANVTPRSAARDQYQPPEPVDDGPPAGPPPWMQRANRQPVPQQEQPSPVHPLHRYATPLATPEPHYQPAAPFADDDQESDPSRYDEALYGQIATGEEAHDPAYADDAYAYQDGYDEGAEGPARKRGGGMMTVGVILALAVLGTGGAFAYRTYYIGSQRSGDAPIIKADPSPTKIIPPGDGAGKVPDRLAAGDGTEKIVPREEVPVDINANPGPRVVFPPLNQGGNPPMAVVGAAPPAAPPAIIPNGLQPGTEPRKIKTFAVTGDPTNGGVPPGAMAKPAPAVRPVAPRTPAAPAPAANAPLSLSPQGAQPAPVAEPHTRVAAVAPVPAPAAPTGGGGGYLVQVSSQRNEADAQASFKALQGKFPTVLGSHSPVIKRADLGDKGVYYRAMVGPFGSPEEASQFCGSLKTAGGQCVVQRN